MKNNLIPPLFMFTLLILFNENTMAQHKSFRTYPFASSAKNEQHPTFGSYIYYGGYCSELFLAYDVQMDSSNRDVFIREYNENTRKWNESYQFTFHDSLDQYPTMAVHQDIPFIVWESNRTGQFDLLFSSRDSMGNWSSPEFITTDSVIDHHPKLLATSFEEYTSLDFLILLWERSGAIYWTRYLNYDWQLPQLLSNADDSSKNPYILRNENENDDEIWAVWECNTGGNWNIWGSVFNQYLNSWTPPQQITEHDSIDSRPVLVNDWYEMHTMYLVWQSNREGNFDLFYTQILFKDDSIRIDYVYNLTMSAGDETSPHCLFLPTGCTGHPRMTWSSNVNGNDDIYFDFLSDAFLSKNNISDSPFLDRSPVLSPVHTDTTYLAWECFQNENWDIMGASIKLIIGNVNDYPPPSISRSSVLSQNYPNPFNASTTIRYQLPAESLVTIEIFDVLGRQVTTLVQSTLEAGEHTIFWNGRDNVNLSVPSGIYFYRLKTSDFETIKKMILLL